MMTCNEVSTLVSTGGLPKAPLTRRLGVRMHLAICRAVRRHAEAIAQATRALNPMFEREPLATFETKVVQRQLP
jgi:hypothetical protein